MGIAEKILDQIPLHVIIKYVEDKTSTPQSVTAGKRVGANPGSRKAKIRAMYKIEVKK